MEKVTGIGAFFFRAKDPKALGRWCEQHLGILPTPTTYEETAWQHFRARLSVLISETNR